MTTTVLAVILMLTFLGLLAAPADAEAKRRCPRGQKVVAASLSGRALAVDVDPEERGGGQRAVGAVASAEVRRLVRERWALDRMSPAQPQA